MTDTTTEAVERCALRMEETALRHKKRAECCGQVCSAGVCAAPACHFGDVMRGLQDGAATLRALAQERDALALDVYDFQKQADIAYAERDAAWVERDAAVKAWEFRCNHADGVRVRLETERDAARAEVERYRIALMDLLSWQSAWPQMARQLAQEGQHMQDAVKAARDALAAKGEA